MNKETEAGCGAVAAPVERPVRPSLAEALQRYWDAAYAEGKNGLDHDTEDGDAGLALRDVMLAVAYEVAAERERWQEAGWARDAEIQRLRARVLELEAVHEDASGAVLQERERCARVALEHVTHPDDPSNEVWQCAYNHVATEIADAIRKA